MAKLGQIKYQKKQPLVAPGPESAVQSHVAKQGVFNATMDAVNAVANHYAEDSVNVATAAHEKVGNDILKFAAENETITQDQLKQLDLAHAVEATNPDGSKMEAIPRHLWLPTLVEQELERSRDMYVENIQSPSHRKAWQQEMASTDQRMVLQAVQNSQADMLQYLQKDLTNSRKAAAEQGNWDMVERMQETQLYQDIYANNPGLKELHDVEVAQGRENEMFDTLLLAEDFDTVMDLASDPERESALSSDDLRKIYFAAATKQATQEADALKLRQEVQERNFVESYAAVAEGRMALQDIINNRHSYDANDFTKLVTFSRTLSNESASGSSGAAEATKNAFVIEMELAKRGVYPEGIETLADFQAYARERLVAEATTVDSNGNLIPGLNSSSISQLFGDIDALEEVPYKSRDYQNLTQELSLRILRAEDDSKFSFMAKEDTAMMYANALDSLHKYIDENGPNADLAQWERAEMPRFLNKNAKAAFFKLDQDLLQFVSYAEDQDGALKINGQATAEAMARKLQELKEQGRSTDKMRARIEKFSEYLNAYGQYVTGGE